MYYHIWFVTKYRKSSLEGDREKRAKEIFLEVAQNKNYSILELETNKDHVHLLVEAKDRKDLDSMVRVLKSVSAKKILEETPHLRAGNFRDAGNVRHFWSRSYGHKIVYEPQLEETKNYIRNQKRIPHT